MGLFTAFKEAAKGNFSDAFNYLWVDEEVIREGNEADSKLTQLIAADAARGVVSQEEANQSLARIQANAFPYIFQQEGTNPALGLKQGALEGAAAIGQFASKSISTATQLTWKIIPWQVWLVLFIALVIYAAPLLGPLLARFRKPQ